MKRDDDIISVQEAARMLGLSRKTVRDYRLAGKLPYIKYSSRKYMFRRADIEEYRASCYHEKQLYLL